MFDLTTRPVYPSFFDRRQIMRRFIVSVLCVTVFCIGLGALVENVGARFKSDEKALALIKQARLAIGGEQSIAEVRSMIIKGNTTHTFKVDGATRTEQGETEIAMQLPDKLSRMVKIGRHDGAAEGEKIISQKHDVIVMRSGGKGEGTGVGVGVGQGEKKIVVRKVDGGTEEIEKIIAEDKEGEFTTSDGNKIVVRKSDGAEVEKVVVRGGEKEKRIMVEGHARAEHSAQRQNELLRTTLSLLLTAPEGMDVNYTYAGESDVDGTTCNVINAEFAGSSMKLYLSKASSLPVMVSYVGHEMPRVMHFKTKTPEGAEPLKDKVTFNHKIEGSAKAEFQIRFSDYRSVNGVQLPYKWTTSVAGQTSEVMDVTGYEINPANIAERFQNQKVFVRSQNRER
jgi:hypothetical protein